MLKVSMCTINDAMHYVIYTYVIRHHALVQKRSMLKVARCIYDAMYYKYKIRHRDFE